MVSDNIEIRLGNAFAFQPIKQSPFVSVMDEIASEESFTMSNKTFFGFALADSMFSGFCTIFHTPLKAEQVEEILKLAAGEGTLVSCLNPSHAATITAARTRFGIEVPIPEIPPQVQLVRGDSLIVMGVRGLPRLTDRHEYTENEIAQATFSFSRYYVIPEM